MARRTIQRDDGNSSDVSLQNKKLKNVSGRAMHPNNKSYMKHSTKEKCLVADQGSTSAGSTKLMGSGLNIDSCDDWYAATSNSGPGEIGFPSDLFSARTLLLYIWERLRLGSLLSSLLKSSTDLLQKWNPVFYALAKHLAYGLSCVYLWIKKFTLHTCLWLWYAGKLAILLTMVLLYCELRGFASILQLGATSFFTIIWCSIISMFVMAGFLKICLVLALTGLMAVFLGLVSSLLSVILFGALCLWIYGSFWTTGFIIIIGGFAFGLNHEGFALLVASTYSIYCVKGYAGWLGLLLGTNLSFLSSDLLFPVLKSYLEKHGHYNLMDDSDCSKDRQRNVFGELRNSYQTANDVQEAYNSQVHSPIGLTPETSSENEVTRILRCPDHYSALSLARYESIDVALLRREYKKKAMLVHPDKNLGNEKAVEAFKKLNNAYEVLVDSAKRKEYNAELQKNEIFSCFHVMKNTLNKEEGDRASEFSSQRASNKYDKYEDTILMPCDRCRRFHAWIPVDRPKSRARWCKECNDFHPAKDGDGWVEQAFDSLVFGFIQKAQTTSAYVCAESKVYEATEWFACQRIKCAANMHRPGFHVCTKDFAFKQSLKNAFSSWSSTFNKDEFFWKELFDWMQSKDQSSMSPGGLVPEESASRGNKCTRSNSGRSRRKARKL